MSEQNGDAVAELTCDEVREMAGAFVLDALEADEAAAVRAHLASCSEAHEEIAELGGVVPVLVEVVPLVEPPAALKERIMAAAAADLAARGAQAPAAATEQAGVDPAAATVTAMAATVDVSAPAATVPPAAPGSAKPAEPVAFPSADERETRRAGRGRTSPAGWILRIAAVLAIVALGTWNLMLQTELNATKSFEQSVAAVLDVAAQPGSVTAILTPDDGTGSGLAAISASGAVTLAMQDLAPTTGNTVYETWVIGLDGTPVPVGSFKVGADGVASFETNTSPAADGSVVALTLEPGPGATAPTGPIVSKGVASSAG